ncbi:MAG: tRNA (adenosine(37)-N6)-threonylcarbamoyltransferase complex transferase subunit TsaD [bacterium JZ-2024 1]
MGKKSLTVLGIDTSCDDSGVGIVRDGKLLAHKVYHQEEHSPYGGVIPEMASRSHLKVLVPLIEEVLREAKVSWEDLSAVGVTRGPGLIGSLFVGYSTALALAHSLSIPFLPLNHLESHLFAAFLEFPPPEYPFVGLIASGGHTELVFSRRLGHYILLGRTRDDAAGEALDKIGRLMGLGYPAGQKMDELSSGGNPNAFRFPVAKVGKFEFSFSGIKTYAARLLQKISPKQHADFLASFIFSIVRPLVEKSLQAAYEKKARSLILAGGVVRNSLFRARLKSLSPPFRIHLPPPELCSDNGAVVAANAYYYLSTDRFQHLSTLPVDPSLDFLPNKRKQ